MPAESRYEFEVWDGLRVGVVCSKAALEAQLSVDCVLDGELVVWTGERLDFDALRQRMVNTPATVRRRLAPAKPASFVAFDVSTVDRPPPAPGIARRAVGSSTATVSGHQRSRRGPRVAERLQDHRCGGPVVKGASTRYQPARRDGVKVNSVAVPSVWARAS